MIEGYGRGLTPAWKETKGSFVEGYRDGLTVKADSMQSNVYIRCYIFAFFGFTLE